MLRDYQQDAVNDAIKWIKSTLEPGLIEAYTAAGKSLIVAEIARIVTGMTGKKVLVLQPNKELLVQNVAKYKLTGNPCSVFSASAGQKSVKHNVVYGTALTVKNMLNVFCSKFCLVILDEADASLTPTILSIIDHMKEQNPQLRVLGLTSSPYKMGSGYIYRLDINDKPIPESQCRDPFFTKQIVHIKGRDLLEQGYVSPIVVPAINEHYDTSGLELNAMGKFTSDSLDRAFLGKGRKTAGIINDLVKQTQDQGRVSGLIFASTHKHADEIYESLPKHLTAIVTDKTTSTERERIVKAHLELKTKYLINVGIFGRGTDFPRLDFIALMRATESSALLHQFIGRLARIHPDKTDGAVFDYCQAIERHCPDGNLFDPVIKSWSSKSSDTTITAKCELCETENEFSARPNEDGFKIDAYGYYVDLNGIRIMTEYGPMSAHYGRRCMALHRKSDGKFEQCESRWTFKSCPHCKIECDIAARYCHSCKGEIVDPNDKLIADFKAAKKNPYQMQCDAVLSWSFKKTLSGAGNEVLKVDFVTEHRSFACWYHVRSSKTWFIKQYEALIKATKGLEEIPLSITYRKQDSGFYEIFSYNQEPDKLELSA